MMRERMSRPNGSVPSGCCQVPPVSHTGGIRRSPTAWRYGSWGETHGARTAAATATSTIPLPTAKNRSRLRLPTGFPEADPWIQVGDGDIGQEVRSEERRVGKEGRSRWAPDQ